MSCDFKTSMKLIVFVLFLLQSDCLTFCLTSAQIPPGELGLTEVKMGLFESFSLLKSVRTFNVWSKNILIVAIARN